MTLPAGLTLFLAQAQPPAPGADRGEEFGKTSPIALVVILLLGIATVLLIRSMTKRLRNVPESFDPPETGTAGPTDTTGRDDAAGPVDPTEVRAADRPSPVDRSGPDG